MNNNLTEDYKSVVLAMIERYKIGRKTIQWRKQYVKRLIISKLLAQRAPTAHVLENISLAVMVIIAISIILNFFMAPQTLSIFVFLVVASVTVLVYVPVKFYLIKKRQQVEDTVQPLIDDEIDRNEGT